MSLSPEIAAVVREEVRRALGTDISPVTVGTDIKTVLDAMPIHEARVFAARLSDAALEYLVATEPLDLRPAVPGPPIPTAPEPGPAAPDAPAPPPATAPVDAVAETEEAA